MLALQRRWSGHVGLTVVVCGQFSSPTPVVIHDRRLSLSGAPGGGPEGWCWGTRPCWFARPPSLFWACVLAFSAGSSHSCVFANSCTRTGKERIPALKLLTLIKSVISSKRLYYEYSIVIVHQMHLNI